MQMLLLERNFRAQITAAITAEREMPTLDLFCLCCINFDFNLVKEILKLFDLFTKLQSYSI